MEKIVNLKFGKFKKSCQILDESNELLILFHNKISFKEKKIVTVEKKSDLIDKNPWISYVGLVFNNTKQKK